LQPLLLDDLVIAAHNAPESSVVSGTDEKITELEQQLSQQNIFYRRLQTSHAFHSPSMDEIIPTFISVFSNIQLKSPQIPFISNVTGDWITDEQATNPNYWATHLRQPVQFSLGVGELLNKSNRILLEVGTGRTLSTLVKQQTHTHTILSSLGHPQDTQSDVQFLLKTVGQLWLTGVEINWSDFYALEQRQRVPLPTYPFQRQRYWIDLQENLGNEINLKSQVSQIKSQTQNQKPFDWFYIPSWERSLHRKTVDLSKEKHCWLIFADNYGVGKDIIQTLQSAGHDVIVVTIGNKYEQAAYRTFTVNPQAQQDFVDLLEDLQLRELLPSQIIYLWSLIGDDNKEQTININVRSLQGLTQAIAYVGEGSVQITIVTNDGQLVLGNEEINPLQASFLGMSKVVSQEIPNVGCRCVDIVLPKERNLTPQPPSLRGKGGEELELLSLQGRGSSINVKIPANQQITQQLITECLTPTMETVVAYRGNHRWQQIFKSVQIDTPTLSQLPLQAGGTYLIVGDLKTGLGSVFSEFLPKTLTTRLILMGEEIPAILKQSLDDAGVENICINIDITDKKQFRSAILEAEDKFGVINGVFYSTPMSNEYSMALLPQLTTAHWDYNYRTKVEGLFVLAEIFRDKTLDFCLLQSSLSSILGGLGLTAYAAANAVIDAFAVQQNQVSNFPWISINWDACRSEDEISEDEAKINSSFIANLSVSALTPQEVWEATSRIMALGVPESVIVSKSNLHERLEQWVTPKQPSNTEFNSLNNTSHARPNLGNEYVAPRNETEEAIGEIWQELLGITPIGINNSFFDLGGHSLMAIQAISRLRDRFGVELSMRNLLYEAPTIAGIAAFIQTQQPQPEDLEEMTALLNEIQSLSPDEVAQQLG
jgi:acyl transferase domain-containing protein